MKQPFLLVYLNEDESCEVQFPESACIDELEAVAATLLATIKDCGGSMRRCFRMAKSIDHVESSKIEPPYIMGRG